MGTQSDGYVEQELLTTFVTCEGDLSDPQFNTKFARLLKQLQKLLLKGKRSIHNYICTRIIIIIIMYLLRSMYVLCTYYLLPTSKCRLGSSLSHVALRTVPYRTS